MLGRYTFLWLKFIMPLLWVNFSRHRSWKHFWKQRYRTVNQQYNFSWLGNHKKCLTITRKTVAMYFMCSLLISALIVRHIHSNFQLHERLSALLIPYLLTWVLPVDPYKDVWTERLTLEAGHVTFVTFWASIAQQHLHLPKEILTYH